MRGRAGPREKVAEGLAGVHDHDDGARRDPRFLEQGLRDRERQRVGPLRARTHDDRMSFLDRHARRGGELRAGGAGVVGRREHQARAVRHADHHPGLQSGRLDELPVREDGLLGRSPARRDESAHAFELADQVRLVPPLVQRAFGHGEAVVRQAREVRVPVRALLALFAPHGHRREENEQDAGRRQGHEQPAGKRPDPGGTGRRQRRRSGRSRVVHAHALISAAPQCRPAPSAVKPTRSPGRIRPAALASWKTSGSVAAVVFP